MGHSAAMNPAPSLPPRRIFLISFNKCGTSSFHSLFASNSIASCHHHHGSNDRANSLAVNMFKNFMLVRDPLTNIDGFTAYTDIAYYADDMFYEGGRLYAYLHAHYPDSYFILATRDVDDWVVSRLSHGGGTLVPRAASALGDISHQEVAALWKQQFLDHNAEVRDYFGRHHEARFLEFDLEKDDPGRIADFLADDFAINPAHWSQRNPTSPRLRERAIRRITRAK